MLIVTHRKRLGVPRRRGTGAIASRGPRVGPPGKRDWHGAGTETVLTHLALSLDKPPGRGGYRVELATACSCYHLRPPRGFRLARCSPSSEGSARPDTAGRGALPAVSGRVRGVVRRRRGLPGAMIGLTELAETPTGRPRPGTASTSVDLTAAGSTSRPSPRNTGAGRRGRPTRRDVLCPRLSRPLRPVELTTPRSQRPGPCRDGHTSPADARGVRA